MISRFAPRFALRFAPVVAVAVAVLSACGGDDSAGPVDDFDWDALFARDTTDSGRDAEPDTIFGPPDLGDGDGPDDPEGSSFGDSCVDNDVCLTETCLDAPTFPAGYCTLTGCSRRDNCADGTLCTTLGTYDFCGVQCESDADCREDYRCNTEADGDRTCVPWQFVDLRPDGDPCLADADCRGGSCLLDESGWPGGTCTTLACTSSLTCATNDLDNRCVPEPDTAKCLRACATDEQCREGYACRVAFNTPSMQICRPDVETPVDVPVDVPYPFTLHCDNASVDGQIVIDFVVAPTTTAWAFVPFTRDGDELMPVDLVLPDGSSLDFGGENGFQTFGSYWFGSINPILVPGIPELTTQVQGGAHQLVLATRSSDLCWYLLEEAEPGATLDIDIVLVDVGGLSAATAPTDPDMVAVLGQLNAILTPAGVSLGEVRFFDASEEVVDEFAIIRSDRDASDLTQTSFLRASTVDEALRMNLFFTRGFNFGGVIGISMGILGAPGLHGSPASGVVFTSEYLGDSEGNALTGQLIAHEMGHFLGLFHTTEMDSVAFDNLDDTAACTSGFPDSCPDLRNLMFPYAGVDHTQLSPDQGRILQYNPLTKP